MTAQSGSEEKEARWQQEEKRSEDVIWVEFEPGDPENPFNFSNTRKWVMTILAVFFTAEVAATASAYVSGIPSMERDLGYENEELSMLGISIYALGFSLPPLVLAPLSEVFGRNVMYLSCHLLYTILFLGVGFAQNIQTVLICRFLGGAMGSTGSTMVGGTISDLWKSSERGQPMALFATAAIVGTGFGPVWSGFVEQNSKLEWRWIQHIQCIYTAVGFVILAVFLKETRGTILLIRRARMLRKETGDQRYRARAEDETASIPTLIRNSLTRPIIYLFTEPIVTSFSLWIAFVWGFMYMLLESVGLVAGLHNYGPGITGLLFLSIVVAGIVGNLINPIQEKLYEKNVSKKGPEARLYLAGVGAFLFPIGCFIYGWTAYPDVSIAGPMVGVVVLMIGVYNIYLAVFNYLADTYLIYASSALAAQSFARNIFGFIFPLFVKQMYKRLGYQWASTLAGILGAVLGAVPFVLYFWGQSIRKRSKVYNQIQKTYAN
ncbi:MFS general substrate transporter [Violaceomyces palustris]|uniref:MFS general substrate transporter n=1 Tax=Violaceomyces palustris TaxID=1673888 RepID=A0ACD0P3D0_9BASI|nr:MFS general substrate transporter [Violaceomyces palustris]